MTLSPEDISRKRDELIFDLIKKRYENELDRIRNLDNKASNIVGFVSVGVSLLLGGGSIISGGGILKSSIFMSNHLLGGIYFTGVGFLLLSIGSSLTSMRIRKWSIVPNVQTLISDYIQRPYIEVLQRNAGEMAKVVMEIEVQNNKKAKLIEFSWSLLMIGLCIVFVTAIVFIFNVIKA